MMTFIKSFNCVVRRWFDETHAISAVEASMIFPVMLLLFVGVFDLGNALLVNQKTVRASQIVADLITRENVVSDEYVTESVEAGRLAFEPLSSESYGVDIVSIRFDEDENSEIVWRETVNMTPIPNALNRVSALVQADDGVVMVAVIYNYEPLISGFAIEAISMQEIAFSRGRSAAVINKN